MLTKANVMHTGFHVDSILAIVMSSSMNVHTHRVAYIAWQFLKQYQLWFRETES